MAPLDYIYNIFQFTYETGILLIVFFDVHVNNGFIFYNDNMTFEINDDRIRVVIREVGT